MKYYLLAFIFLSAIVKQISAQTFSQEFLNTTANYTTNYAVINSTNSGWIILTENNPSNNFRNTISIVTTNNNGVIQMANLYETADSDYSISSQNAIELPNGDFLITGTYNLNNSGPYYPFLMSVDPQGNINWTKRIDISNLSEKINFTLLSDNSILCNMRYNDGFLHHLFFRMDNAGNLSDFYECNLIGSFAKNILAHNGSFDLLFSDGNFINLNNDLQTINWQRKYNHAIGITINEAANGDYLLATAQVAFPGHMTVSRLNSSGSIIWSKYIETSSIPTNQEFDIVDFHFIAENADNDIVICANSEGGGNGSLLVTLDANGNYIANHKTISYRNKMSIPTDNSYVLGGFVNMTTTNPSNIVFNKKLLNSDLDCDIVYNHTIENGTQAILTPDDFTLTPVTAVPTHNISINKSAISFSQQDYCEVLVEIDNQEKNNSSIEIYPNPVDNFLNIDSKAPVESVSIYDMTGKMIFTSYERSISLSHLNSGVYYIKIVAGENATLKKIIKN